MKGKNNKVYFSFRLDYMLSLLIKESIQKAQSTKTKVLEQIIREYYEQKDKKE